MDTLDWILIVAVVLGNVLCFALGMVLGWQAHKDRERFAHELKVDRVFVAPPKPAPVRTAPTPPIAAGEGKHRGPAVVATGGESD